MNCSNCGSGCSGCDGCDGSMELTQAGLTILEALGTYAFLPVARLIDDPTPVYLEDTLHSPVDYSVALELLEKMQLISIDFSHPLSNTTDEKYADFPIVGSMGLTARGQKVLETIELQGITP